MVHRTKPQSGPGGTWDSLMVGIICGLKTIRLLTGHFLRDLITRKFIVAKKEPEIMASIHLEGRLKNKFWGGHPQGRFLETSMNQQPPG